MQWFKELGRTFQMISKSDEAGRQPLDAYHWQPQLVPVAPQAGLVHRFGVVVFSVITKSTGYDRIYDDYPDVTLDMVASQTFDGRIQLLEYVPRVLAGPPGTHRGS